MPRKRNTTDPNGCGISDQNGGGILTGVAPEIVTDVGEEVAPTETKKNGRPCKNIDRAEFEKLCAMQCTREEIAGFFDVDEDTVTAWCRREYGDSFSAVFARKRQGGRASLRRKQWLMADTSAAMAIFLGKQYLGQSDDPARHAHEESQEDRVARLLDVITDAVTSGGGESDAC